MFVEYIIDGQFDSMEVRGILVMNHNAFVFLKVDMGAVPEMNLKAWRLN